MSKTSPITATPTVSAAVLTAITDILTGTCAGVSPTDNKIAAMQTADTLPRILTAIAEIGAFDESWFLDGGRKSDKSTQPPGSDG